MILTDIPFTTIGAAAVGIGALVTSYVNLRKNSRETKGDVYKTITDLNATMASDLRDVRDEARTQRNLVTTLEGQLGAMRQTTNLLDDKIKDMKNSIDDQNRFILAVKNSAKAFGLLISNEGDLSLPASVTIMIIGNEGKVREATQELLATHGFSLAICGTRNEAMNRLATLRSSSIGVIILDVVSFGLGSDPYEFIRSVRRLPGYSDIPFILALEFSDPSSRRYLALDKELPTGVFLFPVPFNKQQLLQLIQDISSVTRKNEIPDGTSLPNSQKDATTRVQ